jgi:hypothetical protein
MYCKNVDALLKDLAKGSVLTLIDLLVQVCRFSVGLLELCFGSACWRFIGVQPKLQSW